MIKKNYLCNVLCKFLIKIKSMWRQEIKEQVPQLTLKIQQYPKETPVLESLFKKVAGLKARNFIKKRPQLRCFPVNILKFSRLPILKNICKQLLLTVSMVQCYMGLQVQDLNCMMASGFRVQVTGLVFCF